MGHGKWKKCALVGCEVTISTLQTYCFYHGGKPGSYLGRLRDGGLDHVRE